MVRGLERFREHFRGSEACFAVIGGTACEMWLHGRGLGFRRTRDIDIVLIAEQVDRAFADRFREFVAAGGYQHCARATGRPVYYRFTNPVLLDYPEMVELFSRRPPRLNLARNQRIARIEVDRAPASLSAILLDDHYYDLVLRHRVMDGGLPCVSPGALIPMKAYAWLDLTRREAQGEAVDEDDIRKHRNDVFRLALSLAGPERFQVAKTVAGHLREFLGALPPDSGEWTGILGSLRSGFRGRLEPADLSRAVAAAFGLEG